MPRSTSPLRRSGYDEVALAVESFVEGHGDRYTDLLGGTATRRTHGEDVMPRVAASPIGSVYLSVCHEAHIYI